MTEASVLKIGDAAPRARGLRIVALSPGAALILLALLVAALNPIGYVGGGGDDWHYLRAAECWAANGPCVAHDHWTARWPLIAPMAGTIAAFGESRLVVSLVPFLYGAAALASFAYIAERLFGHAAALAGGCALLLTPAFSLSLTRPNVDMVELAWLLGALAALLGALSSRRRALAALAGALLALAVLSRETSFVFAGVAGLWFLAAPAEDKKLLLWAAPGFALPLLGEMLVHWLAAGEPLHRLSLAFGHTRIVSTELAPWVDMSRSPILNPDFIAGWKASNGIDAHWTVKPVLNLFSHPEIGFTLLAAILLFVAFRREVAAGTRRRLGRLLASAGLAALLLTYVLAIDPKPRMFLPLACAAAAAIGALAPPAWAAGRRLLPVFAALLLAPALLVLAAAPTVADAESVAAGWVAASPDTVTLDETTRRHFALLPQVRALPVGDESRPLRLKIAFGPCAPEPGERTERSWSFAAGEPAPARIGRSTGILPPSHVTYSLCLFRRS